MITFIHGDDLVSSRKLLLEIKQNKNAQTFHADSGDPHTLLQLIQGNNLFDNATPIVIENLFSKKSTSNFKLLESKAKVLRNLEVYIWESKELSKSQVLSLGKAENRLFKVPQKIFYFLDNVRPGKSDNIKLFHNALIGAEAEFIFFMLIRQFRLLINMTNQEFEIDEVKRLAPWQKNKLVEQSKRFGIIHLIQGYKKLFEIESKAKTGNLSMPFVAAIDIFLAGL